MVKQPKFFIEIHGKETNPQSIWSLGEVYESPESTLSQKVPYIESTDYIETSPPDWTLEYWVRPRLSHNIWGTYLNERILRKLSKMIEFYPLEEIVKEVGERIRTKYNLLKLKTQTREDPDTHADLLVVDITIGESDLKRAIELWKRISEEIRKEIDEKFKERSKEYQRKLLITVQPTR
ncbi:MAG: hypothetical protein H0Z28_10065 [Archaeoglobus sp.]|nr:hypothetical protein [Archaeoglobus sp.]